MKNYRLIILSILLSCCLVTSIQLTATASTQPEGKDFSSDWNAYVPLRQVYGRIWQKGYAVETIGVCVNLTFNNLG